MLSSELRTTGVRCRATREKAMISRFQIRQALPMTARARLKSAHELEVFRALVGDT